MASLPTYQTDDRSFSLMQSTWSSVLNPVLAKPQNNGSILQNISISTGSNVINHKLGQKMQGWVIIDTTAAITLYRSAALNDLTLTLTASGPATISLMVF